MSRRNVPGPPPGIFSGPGAEDVIWAWAVPAVAGLAAVATCGVWLAGEISYVTGGFPRPGTPPRYARSLIDGNAPWPDAWGWAALALALALVATTAAFAFRAARTKFTRKHRADQVARLLAPRTDRQRLGPRARAQESARLSPDDTPWTGSPIGRIIPGWQLACSGPEDVSIDVWGARAGKTTKRVIPAILDAPGAVLATSNKRTCLTRRLPHARRKAGRGCSTRKDSRPTDARPSRSTPWPR